MPFVDNLKDIARKKEKKFQDKDDDFASQIRDNPQYERVIEKLRQLYLERQHLWNRLNKIELDINTCLVVIAIAEENALIRAKEETTTADTEDNWR